jgi:hypothetical protein
VGSEDRVGHSHFNPIQRTHARQMIRAMCQTVLQSIAAAVSLVLLQSFFLHGWSRSGAVLVRGECIGPISTHEFVGLRDLYNAIG